MQDVKIETAPELLRREFATPKWLIEGLLPPGLTLLSAAPKSGKSLFCLQALLCISTGTRFPGVKTKPRKMNCGYFVLEDRAQIVQERITTLLEGMGIEEAPENLLIISELTPSLNGDDKKAIALLSEIIDENNLDFVVIDTLVAFLSSFPKMQDYSGWHKKISGIARALLLKKVNCLLVHHTRKAYANEVFDPLQAAHGSIGLTAAVENVALLKKNNKKGSQNPNRVLHLEGKQVVETAINLKFEDGVFVVDDIAPEIQQLSDLQKRVFFQLVKQGRALGVSELTALLGKSPKKGRSGVYKALQKLSEKGMVNALESGLYKISPAYAATKERTKLVF